MTYVFQSIVFAKELIDRDIFYTQLRAQEYLEKKAQELVPTEEEPAPKPVEDLNALD